MTGLTSAGIVTARMPESADGPVVFVHGLVRSVVTPGRVRVGAVTVPAVTVPAVAALTRSVASDSDLPNARGEELFWTAWAVLLTVRCSRSGTWARAW